MKHSIRPDLIFMLESQIANIHDFISYRDRSIPVLCDITASPQVLHTIGNPIRFFSSEFHPIRLLERMNRAGLLPVKIPALGSVGIAAVYGALRISSGPVFVTGLDFSYSGGKTHARGSPFQEIADLLYYRLTPASHTIYASIKNRPVILLKDKNGADTESDLILLSYAKLMGVAVGRNKERVADIGKCGINLNLRRIGDGEELDSLITMNVNQNFGRKKEANSRLPGSGEISSFIRNEIDLLEKASVCVKRFLNENDAGRREIDVKSMGALRDIDYTFLHFPEPNPDPVLDKSYLARLLVSIMHYMEIEKRALTLLS
jgi:hypothetical protein